MSDVRAFRNSRSAAEEVVSAGSSTLWCCCVGVWGGVQGLHRIMDVKIAFFSHYDRARRREGVSPSIKHPKMENVVEVDRVIIYSDAE
jgi:hypothetical protein